MSKSMLSPSIKKQKLTLIRLFFSILICTTLISCASKPEKDLSEEDLYESASRAIKARNFLEATRQLEMLESRYPFGRYAEQAQLDLIYARYSGLDLEGARAAANRFIRLHPTSENADYAYYIRGLAAFNTDGGMAAQWFPIDPTSRDPGEMRQAFVYFTQLITRFPESQYAADARQRMVHIRNRLAKYDLHGAKYYIRREAYLAAVNRAKYVVENYPKAPTTETALILMAELYGVLKLEEQANDTIKVLAASFPESKAFDKNNVFRSQLVKKEDRSLTGVLDVDWFDD